MTRPSDTDKIFTQSDIDIAVLKNDIEGLRAQQKAHAEETKRMLAELSSEVIELTAALNRGKGMFAGCMMVAGIVGAASIKLMGVIFR